MKTFGKSVDLFSQVVHESIILLQHFMPMKNTNCNLLWVFYRELSNNESIAISSRAVNYSNRTSRWLEHPRLKVVSILKAETKTNKLSEILYSDIATFTILEAKHPLIYQYL